MCIRDSSFPTATLETASSKGGILPGERDNDNGNAADLVRVRCAGDCGKGDRDNGVGVTAALLNARILKRLVPKAQPLTLTCNALCE
eukprot:388121-Prorocentrum_lima.AAC.1